MEPIRNQYPEYIQNFYKSIKDKRNKRKISKGEYEEVIHKKETSNDQKHRKSAQPQ